MRNAVVSLPRWILLAGLAIAGTAISATAQEADKPDKPDKADPAIAEKVDQLDKAMRDRRMRHDADAVRLIGELGDAAAGNLHPDDRKRVLRGFTKALTKGRLRPPERTEVYRRVADALSKLGGDGAKVLYTTFKKKRFPRKPEWASMRASLVANIGKTKEPKMIGFLIERANRDPEDDVLAATGEALGHFDETDLETRKEIAKAMVNKLGGLESMASQQVVPEQGGPYNFGPQNAQQTLSKIRDVWNATLRKLTGQSFASGVDWQHWYNKHRGDDWDADRGGR